MTEDELMKLSELMNEGYRMREKQLDRMITLYEQGEGLIVKSEERIAQVNAMVKRLTEVVSNLTETYAKHIERLCACRDAVVAQNGDLIKLLETERRLHMESERRLRDIFDKVILTSKPSVSVG